MGAGAAGLRAGSRVGHGRVMQASAWRTRVARGAARRAAGVVLSAVLLGAGAALRAEEAVPTVRLVSPWRVFVSAEGRPLEARYLGRAGEAVLLERRADGRRFEVPASTLGEADRRWLAEAARLPAFRLELHLRDGVADPGRAALLAERLGLYDVRVLRVDGAGAVAAGMDELRLPADALDGVAGVLREFLRATAPVGPETELLVGRHVPLKAHGSVEGMMVTTAAAGGVHAELRTVTLAGLQAVDSALFGEVVVEGGSRTTRDLGRVSWEAAPYLLDALAAYRPADELRRRDAGAR